MPERPLHETNGDRPMIPALSLYWRWTVLRAWHCFFEVPGKGRHCDGRQIKHHTACLWHFAKTDVAVSWTWRATTMISSRHVQRRRHRPRCRCRETRPAPEDQMYLVSFPKRCHKLAGVHHGGARWQCRTFPREVSWGKWSQGSGVVEQSNEFDGTAS